MESIQSLQVLLSRGIKPEKQFKDMLLKDLSPRIITTIVSNYLKTY